MNEEEDKILKEALGRIGLTLKSIRKSVQSIELILKFLFVIWIITFIIDFLYRLLL